MQPRLLIESGDVPVRTTTARAPLKIAFAMINCNRRDGSARPVNEVAERLADRGHDVHLYARQAEDLDLRRVKWHRVPGPGWPEVVDFGSYHLLANHMLRGTPFDIIHSIGCNTSRANVVTIQNIQPAKQKVVERLSEGEKVSTPRRLTRALYSWVTASAERRLYTSRPVRRPLMFLPVSRGVESELRRHYDIGNARVRIVPNAADTDKFKPLSSDERQLWREANGIGPGNIMALFAGGEWARKGLDFAIGALGLVRDKRIKLYVAGDDPARERYVRMAHQSGCADRVIFGGFRQDIAEVMGAADFLVFPSWYEAFSLATIEAAACGLPILATRINGTEDFIQPGVNGEFLQQDAPQVAAVMDRLCSNWAQLREMGFRARRLVEERYTWDRVAAMTVDAYGEYLDGARE